MKNTTSPTIGWILVLTICVFLTQPARAQTIYVDANAIGANDGSSWTNAYNYLQDAFGAAQYGDEIWVAEGIYKPDQGNGITPGDRAATFQLLKGVAIYGGFPPGGGAREERDPKTHKTILSGDLDGNDVEIVNDPCDLLSEPTRDENSYHVIIGKGIDDSAILDGFIISGGKAEDYYPYYIGGGIYIYDGSPTLRNCVISRNSASSGGGGIYCSQDSYPTVINCMVTMNSTMQYGGGMKNLWSSSPILTNCVFKQNWGRFSGGGLCNWNYCDPVLINCALVGNSSGRGGGIYNRSSAPILTNCTFSGNSAKYGGSGIFNEGSSPTLVNCILWGNRSLYDYVTVEESQIRFMGDCEPLINYCCIQGWTGALGGEGNISSDPMFVSDPYDCGDNPGFGDNDYLGDMHLMKGSPCIDSANSGALPQDITDLDDDGDIAESIPIDLNGNDRIVGLGVDMGPYEGPNQGFIIVGDPVVVPEGGMATFTVSLAMRPNSFVYTTVAFHSGDQDIIIQSGQTLLFDAANFNSPQIVTLAAVEDVDYRNGNATMSVSAEDIAVAYLAAKESDNDATTLFVDANALPGGNGLSWQTAFNDLQDALDEAADPDTNVIEIWTAKGTYKPDRGTGDQQATFKLINGVKICGGFPPDGGNWEQRDPKTYETILSGDLNGDDVQHCSVHELLTEPTRSENSYNVISGSSTDATAVLDGFTVTAGSGNEIFPGGGTGGMYNKYGSPTVVNCIFTENSGLGYGGAICNNNGSPTFINCTFSRNLGRLGSGGMHNTDSNTVLINCVFIGNFSDSGAIFNQYSSPVLINCTLTQNFSRKGYFGGMENYNSNPTLANCIFWGNTAMRKFQIGLSNNSTLTVSYSNIQGGQAGVYVGGGSMLNWNDGNIDIDPGLTPDLHLRAGSICIDVGDSNAVPPDTVDLDSDGNIIERIPFDIDGDPRLVDDPNVPDTGTGSFSVMDMGADEFLDSDDDGLPDWWEQKYFGDPNAADPNDDPDGDRITNLEEYELYSSNPIAPPYWVNNKRGNDAHNGLSHNPRGNGIGPKKTIQAAINAANGGDTIIVTPGTYDGPNNIDLDFDGKAIVLRSLSGSAPSTVIDCGSLGRAFYFHSGETAATAVVGFTITNGLADYGGAIRCERSNPQIRNCVVIDSISKPVVRTVTLEPHEIPVPGGGYYWDGYDFSDQTKTGEYGGDFYYNGLYFGALSPARQRGVMDVGPVALTSIDPIPKSGYSRLVKAIVGHSYIALAQEGEEGYYILFTVTAKGKGFITIDWLYVNGRIWPLLPGGGIFCRSAFPTLDNCVIRSNSPDGAWMEHGGTQILGTAELVSNDLVGNDVILYGDGTLQIQSDVTLHLDNCQIRCDVIGPGAIEVPLDSELIIEGDAVIDLYNEADPNANGQFICDGLLWLRDNATVTDAQVYVSRASFEDNAIILNSVITAEAGTPFGQFFIEDNVHIWLDRIVADGDRYLDLDPTEYNVNNIHIDIIDVNITEGVGGTQGGLFELRGAPNLVSSVSCDPNNAFFCQVAPGEIPPFDPNNWTINRLELVEDAKLNLTNRFDFQAPYDSGGDYEVLYVKQLILGPNSIFNTAFNRIYYETLIVDPTARVINVPLLGFSLNNISFNDEIDYLTRVKHNNFEHLSNPAYNRVHVKRVTGLSPDPAGMMRMCNLKDLDPLSPTYGDVFNARAKGLFAKSSEDRILIQFEYLSESSDPNVELVIYLTDVPELLYHGDPTRASHYIEVARLTPPRPGRPGSVSSGRLGLFRQTVSVGHLNFISGTRLEFELLGPHNTCILINNWDPWVSCDEQTYCLDIDGENGVTVLDLMSLIGEYGRSTSEMHSSSGTSLSCLDGIFTEDGYVSMSDFPGWDWLTSLNDRALVGHFCFKIPLGSGSSGMSQGVGAEMLKAAQTVPYLTDGSSGFEGELLVAGKLYDPNLYDANTNSHSWVFLSDRLYGFDKDYNLVSGPFARDDHRDRFNGRVIRDHEGEFYQLNIEEGLVPLLVADQNSIVPPSDFNSTSDRYGGETATIYVGLQGESENCWGRPTFDAAFDPCGFVYITPVVVEPTANEPYLASAKLQLRPGETPPYSIDQLYDDPCFFDPAHPENPNLNSLCEIEVDSGGNLYVLNAHRYNESDTLWKYDTESGTVIECRVLGNPNSPSYIPAPIGMHVSDTTGMLYVASSQNLPQANSVLLYVLSKDNLEPVKTIQVNGMGHITDIAEDPTTRTVFVTGFKMETIPDWAELTAPPFYEPYIAKIPYDNNGQVDATCLSGVTDLALPLSIVWTGDKCSGADLYRDGEVNFKDFAIFASQWLQAQETLSADIAPAPNSDGIVNSLDLAVLVNHWLDAGCN